MRVQGTVNIAVCILKVYTIFHIQHLENATYSNFVLIVQVHFNLWHKVGLGGVHLIHLVSCTTEIIMCGQLETKTACDFLNWVFTKICIAVQMFVILLWAKILLAAFTFP